MMKLKLPLFLLLLYPALLINAQSVQVTGKFIEDRSTTTVPGVGVIIMNAKDTTQRHLTTSDVNGNFQVTGLPTNTPFILRTSNLGYASITKRFVTTNKNMSLGSLILAPEAKLLDEITVQGQKTPVVQKGDTTEMSASAYKVNVDATAQDLVQKMPGITIENGTVKAHGEEVKRVMVDGKNFFGDDATAALQNLPADIIDKVQVFNKSSDQAEFTGFDDGNSSKALNIITRADRRIGQNGNFTAGTDFVDKYSVNGRLNLLRNTKKITLTGNANNINNQNFSFQDILGVMGGGGGRGFGGGGGGGNRGGGGGFIGRSSGINKPISFGVNYTNEISKKLTISGSYFFNKQDNYTNTLSTSENTVQFVDTIRRPVFSNQNGISAYQNYNHRFDMKLEYTIDTANSIIWAPRFSTQKYNSNSNSNSYNHNILPDTIRFEDSNSQSDSHGYNYTNDLTFRHKFSKIGRTISLGTTISGNLNDGSGTNYDFNKYSYQPSSTLDQRSSSNTSGTNISANLAYTEPIGKISMLQLGYNVTFSKSNTDRKVYDNNTDLLNDKYSNVYNSDYNTQRAGLTYMIKGGTSFNANVGVDYQMASLTADRTYPSQAKVKGYFDNLLPNAFLTYKISNRSNVRMFYRTQTSAPSVTQLQDVITKSGTLNFSQGNPDLVPQYSNNGMINFRYSNPVNFSNFTLGIMGNYTTNSISNAIFYPSKDTTIVSGSSTDVVTPSGSLTKTMNFKDSWNAMVFANYGFLFMPIKCNFNFSGRLMYSTSPGSVNNILNSTNNYNIVGGLTIASNISKYADFTLSYFGTYSITDRKYYGDITSIESKIGNLSTNTWNHTISLTSTFTLWERLLLKNTVSGNILTGYGSGYNQNYWLWNPSIGMKVFKNKLGQVSVSVYDVLKQNQSIAHTVSAISISDSRTNILQRFLLFSFTYTIRSYGSSNQQNRHGDFGPGGFGPGGPGGGGFGGGHPGGGGPMPF